MPKWSTKINHPAYADDTIVFASADKESLRRTMKVLKDYEQVTRQVINIEKSAFYMFNKVLEAIVQEVARETRFGRRKFPLKYLVCPIFHSRKKKEYYNELIKRIKNKL